MSGQNRGSNQKRQADAALRQLRSRPNRRNGLSTFRVRVRRRAAESSTDFSAADKENRRRAWQGRVPARRRQYCATPMIASADEAPSPMQRSPMRLSDDELDAVIAAARPIAVE